MDQYEADSALSPALHCAVGQRNLNLARELLKAGANVNHKSKLRRPNHYNGNDCTPMIVAVLNDDLKMAKLLLKYDPNVNDHQINGGDLPLHIAAQRGRLEMLRTLLSHPGTRVTAANSDEDSALVVASVEGNYNAVKLLVDSGEHTKDDYSRALRQAAFFGKTNVMRLLLEHGADANDPDPDQGFTPLYIVLYEPLDAVRLLLRNGAVSELPFKHVISRAGEALSWLAEDTTRTVLSFKGLKQQLSQHGIPLIVHHNWISIVTILWFHYFGPNHSGDPPFVRTETSRLSDEEFKRKYKWMIHAVSSLLYLQEGNVLLPHLCRVIDPSVALELCEHTGKTPLFLALETCPRRDETERQNVASGTNLLIEWNPDALKVPHPETQRTPLTCAIVNRVPLQTLQKMIACKNEKWFTAAPKQQDAVTLLPNFLLVAVGKDSYNVSDIYTFSRDFLPDLISSLKSPSVGVPRRGIKRRREQI